MISRLSMAVALCMLANRAAAQSHARKLSSPKPDTDRIACIEDHKRVQTARESGQFLVSSEAAARCAQASCPLLIREDCATWYIELDRHTPSLVLDVRDPRGGDVAGPRVTLGERVLDVHGRAIALDPGTYELRVEAAGFEVRSERIVVRQDEKNRRVTLTLQPLGAPSVGRTSPTTSPAVITLGAFGLAGLGTFAALATAGKLRHSQLDDESCKPGCDRRDVEGVNRMYCHRRLSGDRSHGDVRAGAQARAPARARRRPARPQPAWGFLMRWWPLIALAGCVPISASEYAGGNRTDTRDGEPSELDGAEDTPEATMDAAVEDEPTTAVDADGQPSLDDAGDAEAPTDEAADASGSERPVVSCATDGVFCEDFERYPTCPDVPGPSWDYCEHIGNDTGPAREGLADNGGFALRTRISADAGVRSQRLVREVPLDADYVEASFWMITDPTDNPWFVWLTLQQEVGRDASGEALGYPGVRLIGTGRRMGVAVQTQQSLSPGDTFYHESDLGPWPEDWIHVLLQVDLVKPSVHVEYHDGSFGPPSPWDLSSYDITNVPVDLQYLALGLYSEAPGAVQMLIDDLQAYAAKDGKIIPLL